MTRYLGTQKAAAKLGMPESTFRAKRGSKRTAPIPEPDCLLEESDGKDRPGWLLSTLETWEDAR